MLIDLLAPRTRSLRWALAALMMCSAPSQAADLMRSRQERYQVTERSLPLTRLDEQPTQAIQANGSVAIVHRGQSLGLLRRGTRHVQALAPLASHPNPSFGSLCSMGDRFVVGVHTQPGFTPQGWYVLSDRSTPKQGAGSELQFIDTLRITARPQAADMPFAYQGPTLTRGPMSACAWDGQGLYLGLPGSVGRANLAQRTLELLDVDDPAGILAHRGPIIAEPNGIWVGVDEGGSGQTWLRHHTARGKTQSWALAGTDDPVAISALARHQGHLYVGTSHGLFRLDESAGRFVYQDLGDGLPGEFINALYADANALWVFSGGQWLRLNTRAKTATRFVLQPSTPLVTGVPFEDYWLVGGPEGVWRTPALVKPEAPANTAARRARSTRPASL